MASSDLRFQSTAWLLLERKTTFYSPRYRQERVSVRCQVLPFWPQPQVVLQLGPSEYLVLQASPGDACGRSGDPKESKKLLQLTVRPLDDVKRAQLYQTAARAQALDVFVDAEHTRERLLRCLSGDERGAAPDLGKKLLDGAFAALESAQKSAESGEALGLYKEAERGFWEAEKLLADDRSRELLRARRGDLQRTIRGLEKAAEAPPAPAPAATVAVPVAEAAWTPPAMDISARLEELRRFAAQQESAQVQAQQENRTDLATRLAALKHEKAGPAPPVDDLAQRLRRLKGDSDKGGATASAAGDAELERKSAADRIIEQVTDEIALGLEEEETDESKELDESDSDSKSESSSSGDSSTDSCKRCTRANGGSSTKKK
ncbi:hypothetical protein PHYPSEUDO_004112 [Phytophthora pseudosyringae]|uniref:Uncharacterized protein n=1 Tax=Phytophthora pseudosyringae TaxID=221518 RepID=A0A8T1WHM4_9STRA|nr:hypothetical protein PHYPSEUDO_004112 [Phytophthora pseudosyringae]